MRPIKTFLFLSLFSLFLSTVAFGQYNTTTKPENELIASWLVSVEGESRQRILKITDAVKKTDGTFLLDAAYGYADGGQTPIHAEATQSDQQHKLSLTTQANTKIVTNETPNGTFTGTFTLKNGVAKGVTITRLTGGELQTVIAAAKNARALAVMVPPKADVPESCAAFFGGWVGTWRGVLGTNYLWIAEIDSDCSAKVSLRETESSEIPRDFKKARNKISQGKLTLEGCGNGTCIFERDGDHINGRFIDSFIGKTNNYGVFKKVQ